MSDDKCCEVPFAERQAWRNGLEEGKRRGRDEARAEIVAALRGRADEYESQAKVRAGDLKLLWLSRAECARKEADFIEREAGCP